MTNKSTHGFSLANLGAVLLIVGIEIVTVFPRIHDGIRTYRLNGAATEVWHDVHTARVLAIKRKRTVRVEFAHTTYKAVHVDTGEVAFSRNLASLYPEIAVDVADGRQEVVFDRTGASPGDIKEILVQGPTGTRRFTILVTGSIGKLS